MNAGLVAGSIPQTNDTLRDDETQAAASQGGARGSVAATPYTGAVMESTDYDTEIESELESETEDNGVSAYGATATASRGYATTTTVDGVSDRDEASDDATVAEHEMHVRVVDRRGEIVENY